jgi:hypothetical protein
MLSRPASIVTLLPRPRRATLMDFIGNPIVALLAALLLAIWTFGIARGFTRQQVLKFVDQSLAPTAAIVLIIGAGGGFKQMLVNSGVGCHRPAGRACANLAAAAGLVRGWRDPRGHRFGHRRHHHRCRHRRAAGGPDPRHQQGTAGAGYRCRFADPVARQRCGLLAGQGILQHERR